MFRKIKKKLSFFGSFSFPIRKIERKARLDGERNIRRLEK
jgi:hypothetical protein